MTGPSLSLHVDMDSVRILQRFWGLEASADSQDMFFKASVERALELFDRCEVKAGFFCIGEDLEQSHTLQGAMRVAHESGHELANHTYSHPIGLTQLSHDALKAEISRCSQILFDVTGVRPVGFRAPSYDIDAAVLNRLEAEAFEYDSSAFWSVLIPAIKTYHKLLRTAGASGGFGQGEARLPAGPYYPTNADWMRPGPRRGLLEIPLPRTRWLQLPFYNNFHLAAGNWYRKVAVERFDVSYGVFLLHLIEFVDLSDSGVPSDLAVHPNLRKSAKAKITSTRQTIERFKQRGYSIVLSKDFARAFATDAS